ncbi:TetR/AcrR family transcriptional regulator [Ensifer sp. SSB1]|uniref:TetR/AcrR family transcriptional regulator n=1 Tax=Ensifer sp. SSB1 TaxID=2795385 RepID=UPI001A38386C|nr:TetR/AcrR family transcriptional regulator [Ensifer sp. SSB1]MBK5571538.1 TetR/AcrR family transcriptional regulator [Ensifer sp. SSB1]
MRLKKEQRRSMLLDRAIELFAENGFEASTHKLADALGVTQPLIYRYFATKEKLLEAVYSSILEDHFSEEWTQLISDRARPLKERLIDFYKAFGRATRSRTWLRLYLYAGLKGRELNMKYIELLMTNIILVIAHEVRHELKLPDPMEVPIKAEELEVIWNLHNGLFYYGVRDLVFEVPDMPNYDLSVSRIITVFLSGYSSQFDDAASA